MAELPPLLSGAVTKPVTPSIGAGEVMQPYSLLADALKKTGEAADTFASSAAERAGLEAGTKAVTTDEYGNTKVEPTSPMIPFFGPAAKHYHDAVKFAALAQGEGAARRMDISLRQQYRDNPEGYNKAATEYMDTLQKQYTQAAGPVVGIALRKALELTTTQTYKGLLSEKERLDLYRQSSAIEAGIEEAADGMGALSNQGVTTGKDWDFYKDKLNALLDQKRDNPRFSFSQEEATLYKEKLTSQLNANAVGYHAVQIYKDRENGGYDKAMEFINDIKTNQAYKLRLPERAAAANHAIQQVNDAAREDERIYKGLGADIKQLNKFSLEGTPASDERRAQVRAAVERTGIPELRQEMDNSDIIARGAKDLQRASPQQIEQSIANVREMERKYGRTETTELMVNSAEKQLKATREGVTKDPLAWSDKTGLMAVPPLDLASPNAAADMAYRASTAKVIAQHYNIPPTFFRADEKNALKAAVSAGGPQMESLAKIMVQGFGEDAPAAMKEISKSAPTLAHIGALQMSGGDEGFTRDVTDGVKMRSDPDLKLPPYMKTTAAAAVAAQNARRQEVYGNAFVGLPGAAERAQEAAGNAFFAQAVRDNYDPALGKEPTAPYGVQGEKPSREAYDLALQHSAGARFVGDVQYGGVASYKAGGFWNRDMGKVQVPPSVKAEQFHTVINAITDGDLKKMAISPEGNAKDIHHALPVATKGGYFFAKGDPKSANPQWIRDDLGGTFKLDFDQLEPELRKRVPDAFYGGR